jgi:hypothetical protein
VSSYQLKNVISDTLDDDKEFVVVTTKQYIAVADDFLRKLFPELAPNLLPRTGAFTLFIKDDDYVLH